MSACILEEVVLLLIENIYFLSLLYLILQLIDINSRKFTSRENLRTWLRETEPVLWFIFLFFFFLVLFVLFRLIFLLALLFGLGHLIISVLPD